MYLFFVQVDACTVICFSHGQTDVIATRIFKSMNFELTEKTEFQKIWSIVVDLRKLMN